MLNRCRLFLHMSITLMLVELVEFDIKYKNADSKNKNKKNKSKE